MNLNITTRTALLIALSGTLSSVALAHDKGNGLTGGGDGGGDWASAEGTGTSVGGGSLAAETEINDYREGNGRTPEGSDFSGGGRMAPGTEDGDDRSGGNGAGVRYDGDRAGNGRFTKGGSEGGNG